MSICHRFIYKYAKSGKSHLLQIGIIQNDRYVCIGLFKSGTMKDHEMRFRRINSEFIGR